MCTKSCTRPDSLCNTTPSCRWTSSSSRPLPCCICTSGGRPLRRWRRPCSLVSLAILLPLSLAPLPEKLLVLLAPALQLLVLLLLLALVPKIDVSGPLRAPLLGQLVQPSYRLVSQRCAPRHQPERHSRARSARLRSRKVAPFVAPSPSSRIMEAHRERCYMENWGS